jgi:predicted ATPase
MQIPKRHYDIQDRHLQLALTEDLDLVAKRQCIYLQGANGYGKSTFLEKVLLPQLSANAVPFVYIGQDLRTQLYCLRALLAVQGHKVGLLSEQALIRLWIGQVGPVQILILDEFDKYFSAYRFIFDATHTFVQTYVIVTHSGHDLSIPELSAFGISRLQFELTTTHQQVKHIRIVPTHGHL